MKLKVAQKMYKDFSAPTYSRVGPVFVRGKGSWLWDSDGKRYLDLFPGWGVSILGHCHPKVSGAIAKQAKKLIHLPNNLYQVEQALLAREIVKSSFPSKVFFSNSGAESVDGAIKFSRLYGAKRGRHEIITMAKSFHGRSFAALSATGQKKYKDKFKPILPTFKEAKLNDFDDFKKKVNKKTIGVMLELIQGEGGVNVADRKYVKQLRDYCKKHDLLFIVDEVQTGMGRTGKLFCYKDYGIIPDIMLLSKGLGAGFPIGAIVIRKGIADVLQPGLHASTFGGSPLACVASMETFKAIKNEKLLANTIKMGDYLVKRLKELKKKFPFITEVRGKGLMVGVVLNRETMPIFSKALEKGLIINSTQGNIFRIMPALNVKKQEIDKGLTILEDIFSKVK